MHGQAWPSPSLMDRNSSAWGVWGAAVLLPDWDPLLLHFLSQVRLGCFCSFCGDQASSVWVMSRFGIRRAAQAGTPITK